MKAIKIKPEILSRFYDYSNLIGVSAATIIEEALEDYLNNDVDAHCEVIRNRAAKT